MKKDNIYLEQLKQGKKDKLLSKKEARQIFDIKSGDTLLVLGDEEQGIAIVKSGRYERISCENIKRTW